MDFPVNIRQFLPHREPFLMVDFVLHLDNHSIETNFKIEASSLFVENGCFNEMGLVENAAQTCSGIVGWPHFESNKKDGSYRVEGFISKIEHVLISKMPAINQTIVTKGELLSMHEVAGMFHCKMKCFTYLNEEELAHSAFTLIVRP